MKNLYIDIDGVIVSRGEAAAGVVEFFIFATENFDCYWLSTHCDGDSEPVVRYLASRLPQEAVPYIERIKPTKWGSLSKTQGIDFSKPFYWLDDNFFEAEKKILEEKGALESFIHVNLRENPNQLLEIIEFLKKHV